MTFDDRAVRENYRQGIDGATDPGCLRAHYASIAEPAPRDVLAAIQFGTAREPLSDVPLALTLRLDQLGGDEVVEYWRASGPVTIGQSGAIRFTHDGRVLFAVIELDEREHGGIRNAGELAYREIRNFQAQSNFPHLLRMWNFMDDVNQGEGDAERYRQFCIGRAQGLAEGSSERYPAATAIGHQVTTHTVQVFWIAGRESGTAIENPRQISAYRYPRTHGPVSPTFSRATVTRDGTLFISGTASIVGHLSQHPDDPIAQFDETMRNLSVVTERARQQHGVRHDAPVLFKVYVRDPVHYEALAARLQAAFPNDQAIFLAADICRRELLLEIECVLAER